MECEAVPVGHLRQAYRQAWEDGDPDHLFKDTYGEAQRQDAGGHVEQACLLDVVSEEPPEDPADAAEKEIGHAPGCDPEPEGDGDVAVPRGQGTPPPRGDQWSPQGESRPTD